MRESRMTLCQGCLLNWLIAAMLTGCAAPKACDEGYSPADAANKYERHVTLTGASKAAYERVQKQIKTKHPEYHDAVVAPGSYSTPYSFYLVGVEKPRDGSDIRPYCKPSEENCQTPRFDPSKFKGSNADDPDEIDKTKKDIEKRLFRDWRPLVLTHVMKVGKQAVPGMEKEEGCFIFNVYGDKSESPWCKHNYQARLDKDDWKREGWKGLDALATDVEERVKREKATHIILLATGWNTAEYESYLDFQNWMQKLTQDFQMADQPFRPVFIGTAWESGWPAFNKMLPFLCEFNKGNDADEIGFGWENYLLNDLMKPIAKANGAQLVAIGHSFGTRIVLGAQYVRHVLERKTDADVPVTIIGMQAAFPVARFVTSEGKEHQYVENNRGRADVIITSSEHDTANSKMCFGTNYIGARCGLEELKKDKDYEEVIKELTAGSDGKPQTPPARNQVLVYDASSFVDCQLRGTHSGAHSDVYDREMGHFLGEVIRGTGLNR